MPGKPSRDIEAAHSSLQSVWYDAASAPCVVMSHATARQRNKVHRRDAPQEATVHHDVTYVPC